MKMIGIIDADLIGRKKHRFPNLACMKLSGFHKDKGDTVQLVTNYDNLSQYDKVYVSKVFTDTPIPVEILSLPNVEYGGTGFAWDKAIPLPSDIEHHMPDYTLYDEWVENCIASGKKPSEFKMYTDYSIGFLTRGCFRKCGFCVNKHYNQVEFHANLSEFYNPFRKKICFLDDNFFGYKNCINIMKELKNINKPIIFKQGLDIRLLTPKKCELLFSLKYDGDYIFAFDNYDDYDLIHEKLELIRQYTPSARIKFYVLVGYKNTDIEDIIEMWERIALLMRYRCLPYIMRYRSETDAPYEQSAYRGVYIYTAKWCNQPPIFKKMSFREFCEKDNCNAKNGDKASMRALKLIEEQYPDVAKKFFDLKFGEQTN